MKKLVMFMALAGCFALGVSAATPACDMRSVHRVGIPNGMQWGVTFGFYATNGYFGSVEAKAEIDAIARAGATWVTVVPTVWQDTCSSSFQDKDFALTPNDIELMDAIDLIHAKGMKVQLRPMLECKDGIGRLGVWMIQDRERMPGRATRERAKWFASMAARSAYYARIAERTKCEAFCIDSEINGAMPFNEEWRSVIAAVRSNSLYQSVSEP